MTQPGETDNYAVSDHLKALISHSGEKKLVDAVLLNNYLPDKLADKYEKAGSHPVKVDTSEIRKLGIKICAKNLVETNKDGLVRHSSPKVARAVYYWFRKEQRG